MVKRRIVRRGSKVARNVELPTTSAVPSLSVQSIRTMSRRSVVRGLILTIARASMKVRTVKNGIDMDAVGTAVNCAKEDQKMLTHNGFSITTVATVVAVLISDLVMAMV
mmetsp:Transcript_19512/g.23252  ORF Transcript_19512/g.23252 Transcript_19512/m.23252 type:complete len:109 (+) Transcript_19512:496-822(+)